MQRIEGWSKAAFSIFCDHLIEFGEVLMPFLIDFGMGSPPYDLNHVIFPVLNNARKVATWITRIKIHSYQMY